ncbi:TetR/AcrR family transcriptional regulator [Leptolyngbya cf. ectocarpi LEGE 11479]|uniref:TetR/AcrR family transcriptional regulator n=1 Tax=Leptolyngbya cf. ectocarpi LEGE 11479 TaxID=1828722 RepID=A0A928ZX81_LEPEC|nr:TetR/AcrR family transcriptional regulator [Leptolyngbya ectocarpi]MBE9069104.1 TetR/AcrR family transcriptional regulator [Leptolyngbya cf. ectocarpi LEGE 11479]
MGRKSLAAERREDILNAFEQCILERGIEGTSFQHIAQVLGMDRKMVSHYFGNREGLVDAMTQRIIDTFDTYTNEALAKLEQSASVMDLVETFHSHQQNSTERVEILWAEISAYATRSKVVRDRLRRSYDNMFRTVDEMLQREYPNVPKNQLKTAAYTVTILIDRSPLLEWLGVKGAPIKSAKAAIETVLKDLK